MKIRLSILLMFLLAVALGIYAGKRHYERVTALKLLNRSLEEYDLTMQTRVSRELAKLGYSVESHPMGLRPWYITKLTSNDVDTLVVIQIYPRFDNPDVAGGVVAFITNGKTQEREFEIGYRMRAHRLEIDHRGDEITMRIRRTSIGPFVQWDGERPHPLAVSDAEQVQWYRITKNRVELTKTTNSRGETISNSDGWRRSGQ